MLQGLLGLTSFRTPHNDFEISSYSENETTSEIKRAKTDAKRVAMKAELRELISQPVIARGVSTKYITSGSKPIIDDLLAGESKAFKCSKLYES